MLKYLYSSVVFSEIPEEISLAIEISGCQIHCKNCHSKELWEDTGTPLTIKEIASLLDKNKGVSCLLLMGGERDIPALIMLFKSLYPNIKTAWYCGLDTLPDKYKVILDYLDYIKLGHYDEKAGPLTSPTSNQKLYAVSPTNSTLHEITYLLRK